MENLKDNAFIKHLEKGISNILYQVRDEEYRKLNESKDYDNFPEAPSIDGFFTLYLDTLGYSPKELFTVFRDNRSDSLLLEILFSSHYCKARQRDEWVEKFIPLLNSDKNFFKLSFQTCLETHHYLETVRNSSDKLEGFELFREKLIQRNTLLFKRLVDIGKNKDYFSSFKKEDFFTKNITYQEILKTENIFNDSISLYDLKNFLVTFNSNKYSGTSFMATYIVDILEMKDNDSFFFTLGNNCDTLITLLFGEKFSVPHEKFESFIDFLLDNPIAHSSISTNKNAIAKIFFDCPNLVKKLIDNIPDKEKYFKGLHINETLHDNYHHEVSKWLSAILPANDNYRNPLPHFNNQYVADSAWMLLFDAIKEQNVDNMKAAHNYIGRIIVTYLYNHQANRITNFKTEYNLLKLSEDKSLEQYIQEQLNKNNTASHNIGLIRNNIDSLGYANVFYKETYSSNNSYDRHNVNQLINPVLEYVNILDPQLKDKIYQKISTNFGLEVYQHIYHLNDNNSSFSSHRDREDFVKNLAKFLSSTHMNSVLDLLHNDATNPLWSTTYLDIELNGDSSNNKRKKFREQYPLAFLLCDLTQGDCLDWFIQPDKLEIFSNMKYKGKNFVSLFVSETWFPKLLKDLITHQEAVDKLVFDSKPAMRALNKLFEDSKYAELKTLFNFTKLSNSIEDKDVVENTPIRRKI